MARFRKPFRLWRFTLRGLMIAVTTFCVAWGLTISWGIPDVTNHVLVQVEQIVDEGSERALLDPMVHRDLTQIRRPQTHWHFVGDARAPFPCIVSIHGAVRRRNGTGVGSREYFFWMLGLKFRLPISEAYWCGG
jgi:hypothetical protein